MKSKVMSSEEAVKLVKDGDTILCTGFVGTYPEELYVKLEERFLETAEPRNLTVVYGAGQGDGKYRSINHFAHQGMLKRLIGAHFNFLPKLWPMVLENQIEFYCFPQGSLLQLFRAMSARQPGLMTKTGLKTFADPRVEGGKMNAKTKECEDIVKLVEVNGQEYLHYQPIKLDVAFIRGTTADEAGNISMEKEFTFSEAYSVALATKSQGGIVIAQVERLTAAGAIHPHQVKVPGQFVDVVVVAQPEYHHQSNNTVYEPAFTGEVRKPLAEVSAMELNERKVICRRGAMELGKDVLVNLGVGVPDGIPVVAKEEGLADEITLTVESGPYGGMPAPGLDFGASYNPTAILEQTNMFDLYDSGMMDVVYLGLAQADGAGNVNVSKFGPRVAGCGGFVNITQNAKKVVFCGTLMAGGLQVEVKNGKLKIVQEGKTKKFINRVDQITFSGDYARESGQKVFYMTERAIFELMPNGLMLTEIAPGVDLQKDVLANIEFEVNVSPNLKLMDERIFYDAVMGIKDEVLAK